MDNRQKIVNFKERGNETGMFLTQNWKEAITDR